MARAAPDFTDAPAARVLDAAAGASAEFGSAFVRRHRPMRARRRAFAIDIPLVRQRFER